MHPDETHALGQIRRLGDTQDATVAQLDHKLGIRLDTVTRGRGQHVEGAGPEQTFAQLSLLALADGGLGLIQVEKHEDRLVAVDVAGVTGPAILDNDGVGVHVIRIPPCADDNIVADRHIDSERDGLASAHVERVRRIAVDGKPIRGIGRKHDARNRAVGVDAAGTALLGWIGEDRASFSVHATESRIAAEDEEIYAPDE